MSEIMWSIAQIAARDNVSKPAVSKAVKKLLEARPDTPVERGGQGQVLGISLAHYDDYRERFVNPAKASAPIRSLDDQSETRSATQPTLRSEDTFDEARRQAEWLKVGREKIRHQQECGALIRKDKNDQAVMKIGAELQSIIRRLPNHADAVALAVSKEGVHGVRVLLRQIAFEIGNKMADKLIEIGEAAPETDDLLEEEDL